MKINIIRQNFTTQNYLILVCYSHLASNVTLEESWDRTVMTKGAAVIGNLQGWLSSINQI